MDGKTGGPEEVLRLSSLLDLSSNLLSNLSTKNHSALISKIEILIIFLSFSTLRVQFTNPGQVPSTWQGLYIEFLLPDFDMPHFLTSFWYLVKCHLRSETFYLKWSHLTPLKSLSFLFAFNFSLITVWLTFICLSFCHHHPLHNPVCQFWGKRHFCYLDHSLLCP